ncbi:hypothetical protein LRS74_12910 [Streptomyces sp. LX-29]|uniref:hypothetical protein n=1 Tax=Streptomyces sp. LX-29 TaxID=2900152 RepID=UPI00240D3E1D|nr:hypothetical protein [Streptomyces sp. LX-29]WFB07845.1 hypothetical protein LRS74_12910 [Streptomyces sp. LX-29]
MHHHGYTWLGSGLDLLKDGPRRPVHPEFSANKIVPLELAHWLLKPATLIQGTWTEPTEAAEWFTARVRMHAPSFASEHHRDQSRLAERISRAVEAMSNGEDVAGGWYLTGQRFLSVCLIACSPHRVRPDIACPRR